MFGGGEGGVIERVILRSVSLQLLSEEFLIVRKIRRGLTINVHRSSCKVPVVCLRF